MNRHTILLALLFVLTIGTTAAQEQRDFWPRSRRIDREINNTGLTFGYQGEWMGGLTASYGTITSEDTDLLVFLDNIQLDGALTTVKPFVGYFYRDNRAVGLRLGYQYLDGELGNFDFDLGEQNDISLNISDMRLRSDSYSVAVFQRAYVALDRLGRFGIFSEVEAKAQFGTSEFLNGSGEDIKYTKSKSQKYKIGFSPGVAVYIFPQVCATVSVGLGGLRYTSVKQYNAAGEQTGSRQAAKMQFRINLAEINFGMVIHLWSKRKFAERDYSSR